MRLRFKSILSRIIWLHLLALAGMFGAISFSAYYVLGASANNFEERVLSDHAAAVAADLAMQGSEWTLSLPPDLETLYAENYGGYDLAVADENGHVIYSSFPDMSIFPLPEDLEDPSFFRESKGD